jgi:hypothetical protein
MSARSGLLLPKQMDKNRGSRRNFRCVTMRYLPHWLTEKQLRQEVSPFEAATVRLYYKRGRKRGASAACRHGCAWLLMRDVQACQAVSKRFHGLKLEPAVALGPTPAEAAELKQQEQEEPVAAADVADAAAGADDGLEGKFSSSSTQSTSSSSEPPAEAPVPIDTSGDAVVRVEVALVSSLPMILGKVPKRDKAVGSHEQDRSYQEWLEGATRKVEMLPSAEKQLQAKEQQEEELKARLGPSYRDSTQPPTVAPVVRDVLFSVREYQTTARDIKLQRKQERMQERHHVHTSSDMTPRELARQRRKANKKKGKSGNANQQRMNAINALMQQQKKGGANQSSKRKNIRGQRGSQKQQKKPLTKPQGQAPVFKVLQRDFPSL